MFAVFRDDLIFAIFAKNTFQTPHNAPPKMQQGYGKRTSACARKLNTSHLCVCVGKSDTRGGMLLHMNCALGSRVDENIFDMEVGNVR